MISLEIETTTTQTDRETINSHHIETILNFQIHKVKNADVVHRNIKVKLIEYDQQKKPIQIITVLTTQKTRNYS